MSVHHEPISAAALKKLGHLGAVLIMDDHRPDVNPCGTPKDAYYPDRCELHQFVR